MKRSTRIIVIAAAVVLAQGLTGCAAALIGGGAAVAGMSIADRRPTLVQAKDTAIEIQARTALLDQMTRTYRDPKRPMRDVSTVSYNGHLLLMGIVPAARDKMLAGSLASKIDGVRRVYNYLQAPGEGVRSDYAQDSIITSKVRTALIKPVGFSSNHVKIVTYGGVTYAMGLLTPDEQRNAARQISTTAGVRRLVTLFENYNPQPGP